MTLDYDTILASLKITWNNDDVRMVAGWSFYDAGMDPVRVMIYDIQHHYSGERVEYRNRVERRMCIVQGRKGLNDTIIDYMEGW